MARCISPVYVRQEKGGIFAPCGRCIECLKTKQGDWSFRLKKELKGAKTAYFITLTYNDEYQPRDGNLKKEHLQNFFKRLRYYNEMNFKYYAVGEYGSETYRPHYHAIIFNLQDVNTIEKAWKKEGNQIGFVHVGTVTSDSIAYVTKYIINKDVYTEKNWIHQLPFAVMSKNLGLSYIRENWKWHKSELKNYVMDNGYKKHMPRYYADKIFSFKDKQKIADVNINRLSTKEAEEMSKFSSPTEYFADRLENRKQSVERIIKKSKKIKL